MAPREYSRDELLRRAKREQLDLKRVEEILDDIDCLVAEEKQAMTWRNKQTKINVKSFKTATDRVVDAWKDLPPERGNRRRLVEALLIIVEECEQTQALLKPGDYQRLDAYRKELAVEQAFHLRSETGDPMAEPPARWKHVAAIFYGKGTARQIERACRKYREERQAVTQWAANNRELVEATWEKGFPIVEPHYVSGDRKPRLRFGIVPFFKEGEEPTWPVDDLVDPPEQLTQYKPKP